MFFRLFLAIPQEYKTYLQENVQEYDYIHVKEKKYTEVRVKKDYSSVLASYIESAVRIGTSCECDATSTCYCNFRKCGKNSREQNLG